MSSPLERTMNNGLVPRPARNTPGALFSLKIPQARRRTSKAVPNLQPQEPPIPAPTSCCQSFTDNRPDQGPGTSPYGTQG